MSSKTKMLQEEIKLNSQLFHFSIPNISGNESQYVAWGYPSGTRPEVNPFV